MEINKTKMNIGGVAHPSFQNPVSLEECLRELRLSFSVLISLDDYQADKIKILWEKTLSGKHYLINIPDFKAPTSSQMMEINDIVSRAASSHQEVVIHCRYGKGRTGTILAALKLRSLIEHGAKSHLRKTHPLPLPVDEDYICTTSLVMQAVEFIRSYDVLGQSVEVAEQVYALEEFEEHISKPNSNL